MENITTIKQLALDHRYYCSDTNYYDNNATLEYFSFEAFLYKFGDADIDYNLCFRWDVSKKCNDDDQPIDEYRMYIFIMQQKRGKFIPVIIHNVHDSDVQDIIKWLTPHKEYLKSIWEPFSFNHGKNNQRHYKIQGEYCC